MSSLQVEKILEEKLEELSAKKTKQVSLCCDPLGNYRISHVFLAEDSSRS